MHKLIQGASLSRRAWSGSADNRVEQKYFVKQRDMMSKLEIWSFCRFLGCLRTVRRKVFSKAIAAKSNTNF